MVNVAILGFGVVGGGITEVIEQNKKALKAYVGDDIYVKTIITNVLTSALDVPIEKIQIYKMK